MLEKSPNVVADSRAPLELSAVPSAGIRVVRGYADIFVRIRHGGAGRGRRRHIARIPKSGAIFGTRFATDDDGGLELIAVAGIDTEYGEIDAANTDARALLFENWATAVTARMLAEPIAREAFPLTPGHAAPIDPGKLVGRHHTPLWLCLTSGSCTLGSTHMDVPPGRPKIVFLPAHGTLRAGDGTTVEVMDTSLASR